MMYCFHFLLLACTISVTLSMGIEGKQVVREVFPDPLHSNIDFGVGYNSITVSRTGTAAVNISQVNPRSRSGSSAFMSHTFQIKHFVSREELQEEYGKNSEITKSEGLVGSHRSKFLDILMAEDVSLLDSVLTVDVDIVTDSESVRGQVVLKQHGKNLLDAEDFGRSVA